MTEKLDIFNGALREAGSRRLASLTENVESRRVLDDLWNGGAVNEALETGFWNHAMKAVKLEYDSGITPQWGYTYAFEKPSDLVRLGGLCVDEYFRTPLLDYQDTGGVWFSDYTELYILYVSNDILYGMDLSKWAPSFSLYVQGYLALRAIKRLTDATTDMDELERRVKKYKTTALSHAAQANPTSFPIATTWQTARSRFGDFGRRRQHPYR